MRDDEYKGKEIAECLEKDPVAATEYFRRRQDLWAAMERLNLLLNGVRNILV